MRLTQPMLRGLILVSAVLIWANVQAFALQVRTLDIEIQTPYTQNQLALATPLPTLEVQLAGRANKLRQVDETNLVFGLDWGSIQPGQVVSVPVTLLSAPADVDVVSWSPQELTVRTEAISTRQVPVSPSFEGHLADGHRVDSVTTNPELVEITGASSLLANLSEVIVDIELDSKRQTFKLQATPRLPSFAADSRLPIQISPDSLDVQVNVSEGASTRTLGIQPTFTGEIPAGYYIREVRFDPQVLTLEGSQKTLNSIALLSSTPINLDGKRQTYTVDAAVVLPTGVKVVGQNLLKATIEVLLAQSSREFVITPQFVNPADGLSVTAVTPKNIRLVVVGENSVLESLKRTDIELNIDIEGALTGSNQITLNPGMFKLPPGVSVGSFTPEAIEVILSRL